MPVFIKWLLVLPFFFMLNVASAQSLESGRLQLGTDLGFQFTAGEDFSSFDIRFGAAVEYFFSERFSVGGTLGFRTTPADQLYMAPQFNWYPDFCNSPVIYPYVGAALPLGFGGNRTDFGLETPIGAMFLIKDGKMAFSIQYPLLALNAVSRDAESSATFSIGANFGLQGRFFFEL